MWLAQISTLCEPGPRSTHVNCGEAFGRLVTRSVSSKWMLNMHVTVSWPLVTCVSFPHYWGERGEAIVSRMVSIYGREVQYIFTKSEYDIGSGPYFNITTILQFPWIPRINITRRPGITNFLPSKKNPSYCELSRNLKVLKIILKSDIAIEISERFLKRSDDFKSVSYCPACGAFDLGLAVSVPLPIVTAIFVLLWFQSRLT